MLLLVLPVYRPRPRQDQSNMYKKNPCFSAMDYLLFDDTEDCSPVGQPPRTAKQALCYHHHVQRCQASLRKREESTQSNPRQEVSHGYSNVTC